MNRSYSKIRHIQESNNKLERRLLSEQFDQEFRPTPEVTPKGFKVSKFEDDMNQVKSKMENLLEKLKSENVPIDKKRFMKQLQREIDAIFWKYYDDDSLSVKDNSEFMSLAARKQTVLGDHFRGLLNNAKGFISKNPT